MILADVNVLVYAHREDAAAHAEYRAWLEGVVAGDAPFALSELVLSGFVRVVTHPRVFSVPTPSAQAFSFCDVLRGQPNAVAVAPGERHWDIFSRLCREADARGNLVADAYLAALAIETGSHFATTDRDYARFRGLSWGHPLDRA